MHKGLIHLEEVRGDIAHESVASGFFPECRLGRLQQCSVLPIQALWSDQIYGGFDIVNMLLTHVPKCLNFHHTISSQKVRRERLMV